MLQDQCSMNDEDHIGLMQREKDLSKQYIQELKGKATTINTLVTA